MTRPSVTTGVRRVGLASRSGIMRRRSGQGFLVGFGVASADAGRRPATGWGSTAGPTSGTATRMAWWTPSRDIQTSVEGSGRRRG